MPARDVPELVSKLQTVQQQAQTLPASPGPAPYCGHNHSLPQPQHHVLSGGELHQ